MRSSTAMASSQWPLRPHAMIAALYEPTPADGDNKDTAASACLAFPHAEIAMLMQCSSCAFIDLNNRTACFHFLARPRASIAMAYRRFREGLGRDDGMTASATQRAVAHHILYSLEGARGGDRGRSCARAHGAFGRWSIWVCYLRTTHLTSSWYP